MRFTDTDQKKVRAIEYLDAMRFQFTGKRSTVTHHFWHFMVEAPAALAVGSGLLGATMVASGPASHTHPASLVCSAHEKSCGVHSARHPELPVADVPRIKN